MLIEGGRKQIAILNNGDAYYLACKGISAKYKLMPAHVKFLLLFYAATPSFTVPVHIYKIIENSGFKINRRSCTNYVAKLKAAGYLARHKLPYYTITRAGINLVTDFWQDYHVHLMKSGYTDKTARRNLLK